MLLPILFFPLIFTLPAFVYLLVWFWIQFISGLTALAGPAQVGGIAWWAHIGGFVAGIVLLAPFLRPRGERRRQEEEQGKEMDYRTAWDWRR